MSPVPANFLLTTLLLGVAVGVSGDQHKSQIVRVTVPSKTSITMASASVAKDHSVSPPPNSCQLVVSTSSKTGFSLHASVDCMRRPGQDSELVSMDQEGLADSDDSRVLDCVQIFDNSLNVDSTISRHTNGVSTYSLQPGVTRIQVTCLPDSRVDHDQTVIYLTLTEN